MGIIQENKSRLADGEWASIEEDFGPLTTGDRAAIEDEAREVAEAGQPPLLACRKLARRFKKARETNALEGLKERGGRGASEVRAVSGGASERRHAQAMTARIERLGNADATVLGLRSALGIPAGGLEPRAALEFLRAPLLRWATAGDLERLGIPAAGHHDVIAEPGPRTVWYRVVRPGGKLERLDATLSWPNADDWDYLVEFPGEKGQREYVMARRSSILGLLYAAAERMALRAPFEALWMSTTAAEPACMWLILTGKALPLASVSITRSVAGSVGVITIHALASVALPETVEAEFRRRQRDMLGHGRRRPFMRRSFRALAFVERRAGPVATLSEAQWAAALQEWNHAHPRSQFPTLRDLRDTCRRAAASLFPEPPTRARAPWAPDILGAMAAEPPAAASPRRARARVSPRRRRR
jgi:hypothetical protein